jgi:hypothetical protein
MNAEKRSNPRLAPFSIPSDLLVVELSLISPLWRRAFAVMLVTPGSPAAELSLLLFPLKENGEGGPTQTFWPAARQAKGPQLVRANRLLLIQALANLCPASRPG